MRPGKIPCKRKMIQNALLITSWNDMLLKKPGRALTYLQAAVSATVMLDFDRSKLSRAFLILCSLKVYRMLDHLFELPLYLSIRVLRLLTSRLSAFKATCRVFTTSTMGAAWV